MDKSLDKIDIHKTESQLKQAFEKLRSETNISKVNKELIIDFIEDSAIGLTSSIKARVKNVGARARLKNLYLLKNSARFFEKKSFAKLDIEDMKKFVRGLSDNSLKKDSGEKYSEQTKANIKKTLILMLRWIHKEGSEFYELTRWIDTRFQKKDPDGLSEEDILKMKSVCNTLKQNFLISGLFAIGCRIEEFLNIRVRDCREVKEEIPYFIITLRDEYSKTKGRDVDLTWKDSGDVLRQWLEGMEDKNPSTPIFNSTYDGVRQLLKKIGERALNRLVTPHLIRHSSATFDASYMTHTQLCIKYGWSLSSNMPDIYIKRAGVERKNIIERFKSDKFQDIQKQNEILSNNFKSQKQELSELTRRFEMAMGLIDSKYLKLAVAVGEPN